MSPSEGPDPERSKERAADPGGAGEGDNPLDGVLRRLGSHAQRETRYVLRGEIARGGMGAIFEVWDEDLRRTMAMKVLLGGKAGSQPTAEEVHPRTLARFLEEAQVTAQLDHPGIVPVHELGLEDQGRVYFTMRLVKGRNLREIFDLAREGREGWNQTRVLMILLKVCEAMAYAHSKKVIHRDLKPDNVMVGRYGEVYVMDWGLARVLGTKDLHDLRPDTKAMSLSIVDSDRRIGSASAPPESTLYTMDGDVVGTPAYMSPEQARGEIDRLGPRSDVYSVGAMLYHLFSGQTPYVAQGARVTNHMVLRWVLEGPAKPLQELDPKLPAELVAICEKAMAREPEERYATMLELAEDLRAYLEQRVVRAYETGAVAEFRKWVRRNRPLAASGAAVLLLALGGLGAVGYVQAQGKRTERELRQIAETQAEEARRQEAAALRERSNVLRLSAFQVLEDLEREADGLWPARPEKIEAYEAWLARAGELVAGLDAHRRTLEELGTRARAPTPEELEAEVSGPRTSRFADAEDAWWHGQLEKLVTNILGFADAETGLIHGTSERFGWGIERRLAFARGVAELTVSGQRARALWVEAAASIADAARSPQYGGLRLEPQLGLLPLGPDPRSGLWEFAQIETGAAPVRDREGELVVTEDTGLVFVLIPGGTFAMGALADASAASNYDPEALAIEGPVNDVTLDPFFLSKYEMTQGQWRTLTSGNPSTYAPGASTYQVDLTHPVEQVSWTVCTRVLERLGLALPTEAQWEYAARAGTDTPWWSGPDRESLDGAANLADSFAYSQGAGSGPYEAWLDDRFDIHAPVGTYRPNPFGLCDVHGNVWEWCRDMACGYDAPVRPGDGERQAEGAVTRSVRGGAFNTNAAGSRSSARQSATSELRVASIGLRPARPIAR